MATDTLPIQYKILCAGSSACFADMVTFPLDTAKVRLQIQGEGRAMLVGGSEVVIEGPAAQYRGLVGTLTTIARKEGARGLFNGLSAGLQRQLCFSSIRIGLYDSVKTTYQKWLYGNSSGSNSINNTSRILAGLTTGATAVLIAQPTDVVKVRFQAQLKGDVSNNYKTTLEAYKTIFRKEGTTGLWKGTLPNASRNAIVNVAEIVCYDIIKDKIISYGVLTDATPCHFVSAVIAGFCATIVASPVDVVKTRYMNSKKGTYKSSISCALQMFKEEGPKAFFKGFTPSFCRLVSWNIVMWITFEKAKAFVQYQRHIRNVD